MAGKPWGALLREKALSLKFLRNRMSNLSGNNAILKSEGQAGISRSFNIVLSYHLLIKISMHSLIARLLQNTEIIDMWLACLSLQCNVTHNVT